MKVILAAVLGTLFLLPHAAMAAPILDFEGFAGANSLVNINPGTPYSEDGFTFTPTASSSAVVDSGFTFDMPGNTTDFFAFGSNNTVTLTGPAPFLLGSLLVGVYNPSTSTSITLTGSLVGGGTLTQTFAGLTTSTLAVLNWSNLQSVTFQGTADSAIDDLLINATAATPAPEPASLLLLGSGLAGVVARARRRARLQA